MTDEERMTSNPTLRPHEWLAAIKTIKRKRKDIANALGITPEYLSRVLSGRPASKSLEKLFRLIVIAEIMPDNEPTELVAKAVEMRKVTHLDLRPMEIVWEQSK